MPIKSIKNYFTELNNIFNSFDYEEFHFLINSIKKAYELDSNIFIFGNGGSGSTASHFACDMNKGVSYKKDKKFKIICLNDNIPTMLAYANDMSYDDIFVEQLKNFLKKDDLVIGVSGSGNSKNVLKAIDYANNFGAMTFGLCGFYGGQLAKISHRSLIIKSNDMQKIEDMHLIVLHCVMQWFEKEL